MTMRWSSSRSRCSNLQQVIRPVPLLPLLLLLLVGPLLLMLMLMRLWEQWELLLLLLPLRRQRDLPPGMCWAMLAWAAWAL